MSYIFNPVKNISIDDDHLIIEDERTKRSVSFKRFRTTEDDLLRAMKSPEGSGPESLAFMQELIQRGIVVQAYDVSKLAERQSRSLGVLASKSSDPQSAQHRLSTLHPLVLGVGGTGSVVVQHLLAAGVERFTLVDGDRVELSNFNRQLTWTTNDVGRLKVDALQDWVSERAASPRIQTFERFVENEADLDELLALSAPVDIVIFCIDSPIGIEPKMVQTALNLGLPIMTGAVGIEFGHVGPLFTPEHNPCLRCWYDSARPPQAVPYWSHGVTNSLVGVLMAHSVIEWVISPQKADYTRLTLDFSTLESHRFSASECEHTNAS